MRTTPIEIRGGALPAAAAAAMFVAYTTVAGRGDPVSLCVAALIGAVGGSFSLLVHELGHARAARRAAGVEVVRIVLMPLGAATVLEGSYRRGIDQLRVAAAGPLASIGFAATLLAGVTVPLPVPVGWALFLLAFLNLVIAVVTLLPVHPYDGHKILVGAAWAIVRSEPRARALVRRLGIALFCCDAAASVLVLFERPLLGAAAVAVGAGLAAERRIARAIATRRRAVNT